MHPHTWNHLSMSGFVPGRARVLGLDLGRTQTYLVSTGIRIEPIFEFAVRSTIPVSESLVLEHFMRRISMVKYAAIVMAMDVKMVFCHYVRKRITILEKKKKTKVKAKANQGPVKEVAKTDFELEELWCMLEEYEACNNKPKKKKSMAKD